MVLGSAPAQLVGGALPVLPLLRPPLVPLLRPPLAPFMGGGPIYRSRPTGIAIIVLGVGLVGLGIAGTPPICKARPSESRCDGMMAAGYGLGGLFVVLGTVLVVLPD